MKSGQTGMNPQPSADLKAPEQTFGSPQPRWARAFRHGPGSRAVLHDSPPGSAWPDAMHICDPVSPPRGGPRAQSTGSGCLRGPLNPGKNLQRGNRRSSAGRAGRLAVTRTHASS